jgi:hypothetical protein
MNVSIEPSVSILRISEDITFFFFKDLNIKILAFPHLTRTADVKQNLKLPQRNESCCRTHNKNDAIFAM